MRAIRVKLFIKGSPLIIDGGKKIYPACHRSLLSFRFFKAWKSPPIGPGGFPCRSNRKTDYANTVTNAFCLAPCLLGPTARFMFVYAYSRCLASTLACSLGVRALQEPRTSLLYVSDVRKNRATGCFIRRWQRY
jgi:hypothetical protein